ncbi:unnamed protein product [Brachionus calyciflorus]|uniref:Uncharacterized protein n=1 Tax=Brachionus calyciflorus TaxID=104777 RepID=A0A814C1L4_9BILA|nr:unnamed protein product [Brachionus calyciflorus]
MRLLARYNNFESRHPFLAICLTSAFGMGAGNLVCQVLMSNLKSKQIDVLLFLTYTIFGFMVSGPFLKFWWDILEYKIFKNPKEFLRPVKMMLLDQILSPYILNGSFLFVLALYGGKSYSEAYEEVKQKVLSVCLESYKVWPLVMILNFYVIPANNRVLFTNAISVLWTTYFTYMVSETVS